MYKDRISAKMSWSDELLEEDRFEKFKKVINVRLKKLNNSDQLVELRSAVDKVLSDIREESVDNIPYKDWKTIDDRFKEKFTDKTDIDERYKRNREIYKDEKKNQTPV